MSSSTRIMDWDRWTRVYNDPSVWQGLIDDICDQEAIRYRQLHPASANTNAVFLLDRAFVIKIYSPFWEEFEFERALLDRLSLHDEIPVPEVVGAGQVADSEAVAWDYLITRFCPARPFSELRADLSAEDARSLSTQLGNLVGALHSIDAGGLASDNTDKTWDELVASRRESTPLELTEAGVLDAAVVAPLESLLDQAIEADEPQSRVVVHGDLGPDHILCAPAESGWTIEAVIDFGDAKIGAPAYEWMPLWFGFCDQDPELARAYLDAYDSALLEDPDFQHQAIAWTLLHDFGAEELIRIWRERSGSMPIDSVATLRQLLWPDQTVQQRERDSRQSLE